MVSRSAMNSEVVVFFVCLFGFFFGKDIHLIDIQQSIDPRAQSHHHPCLVNTTYW